VRRVARLRQQFAGKMVPGTTFDFGFDLGLPRE
jgi:hypothetical protein